MNSLDLSDFHNGKMDNLVEHINLLNRTFSRTALSALVINPDIEIENVGKTTGIRSKYIDLSRTSDGDYELFALHLSRFGYDGLLIDNVDRIPANSDRDRWEEFVRFALKRESDYPILPTGECQNFNEMHIAARCREYPDYLKGKSLQIMLVGL